MDNKSKIIIAVAVILVAVMGAAVFYLTQQVKEKDEDIAAMEEMMEYEKEQLINEYADVAVEMEGISYKVNNDSLLNELNKQQKRVHDLMEELRTVKASDAKKISQLKSELATVRKVLTYYVAQVDSLTRVNTQLIAEKQELGERYESATQEVTKLSEEREVLQGKVNIASQLEARDIVVEAQTKKGAKARYISKVSVIKVSFSILKNITAPTGNKTVYLRITCPDGSVLHKSASDKFPFEDKQIFYSAKKGFEYDGQEHQDAVYYTVTETLLKGQYRVELFIDGHIVGSSSFSFER